MQKILIRQLVERQHKWEDDGSCKNCLCCELDSCHLLVGSVAVLRKI
jgi:hypothetical protein